MWLAVLLLWQILALVYETPEGLNVRFRPCGAPLPKDTLFAFCFSGGRIRVFDLFIYVSHLLSAMVQEFGRRGTRIMLELVHVNRPLLRSVLKV